MGSLFDFNLVASEYDGYYQSPSGKLIDLEENAMVSSFIQNIKPSEMLEIGSGTGHWSSFFSGKGFKVTGIDVSEKMITEAKHKDIPQARFIHANAADLPFESKSFRFIAMITAFEFMQKPTDVLEEINRVLIPGGYVLIAGLNQYSQLGEQQKNDPVLKDARFFTPEKLKQILFAFGSVIEMNGSVFFDAEMNLKDTNLVNTMVKTERIYSGAFIGGVAQKEN